MTDLVPGSPLIALFVAGIFALVLIGGISFKLWHFEFRKEVVQAIITIIVLVASLYVIRSKTFEPSDKHWAFGTWERL